MQLVVIEKLMTLLTTWIVFFILFTTVLDLVADYLSYRSAHTELPAEFREIYDSQKYRESLQYQKDRLRAEGLRRTILTPIILTFLLAGGFNAVDGVARSLAANIGYAPSGVGQNEVLAGLLFVGLLTTLRAVIQIPFSIYDTFVIEERYGFNRTTPATYLSDLVKSVIMGILLGSPILAALIWFFSTFESRGWIYAWTALTGFQLVIVFLAPVLLMPLFNKFSPLADGPLKAAIETYARSEDFKIQGVYTMDGSKRSSKANAFFTGFGPFRRLVLFDTLISKQSVNELTAVVAHEIGHFKRGHILKSMGLSIAASLLLFFLLSLFLANARIFEAFRMQNISIYASIVSVMFLYSPLSRLLSILTQWLSRRFEFEADEYASRTHGKPEELISALKKLSIDHLSNLTPHRLKVWLDYSHPPVLERIARIRSHR